MRKLQGIIIVNAIVLGLFGIAAVLQQNIEFLYYLLVIFVLASLIVATHKNARYPQLLLWGVSVWGWMHMAGGVVPVGNSVLYDAILISILGDPLHVLRYDQVVHVFGTFLVTMVSWYVLRKHFSAPALTVAITVGLVGLGLASINEVIELLAVLFIEQTYVGDYFNMALDLTANLVGAIIASIVVFQRENK